MRSSRAKRRFASARGGSPWPFPRSIDAQIGIAIPEAGIYALPDDATDPLEGRLRDHLSSADAVLVGPGFDDGDETRATLLAVADTRPKLLVLDAFALGVLPRPRSLGPARRTSS